MNIVKRKVNNEQIGSYYIRQSTSKDVDSIINIFTDKYGYTGAFDQIKNIIEGRYIIAINEVDRIIGFFLFNEESSYHGAEIKYLTAANWARGRGVEVDLLNVLTFNYVGDIYFRIQLKQDHPYEYISNILNEAGYERVRNDGEQWSNVDKGCLSCPYYNEDNRCCKCSFILYHTVIKSESSEVN